MVEEDAYRSKTVLIVEDERDLRLLIKEYLEAEGLRTDCASKGTEAIERIQRDPDVVLLLDYRLSDMTAHQVIERLGELDCRVPFIVISGHGDKKVAEEMMKLGARNYAVKQR